MEKFLMWQRYICEMQYKVLNCFSNLSSQKQTQKYRHKYRLLFMANLKSNPRCISEEN